MSDVLALVEVTGHESLHVGGSPSTGRAAIDLHIHCRKVMVGIGIELSLKLRQSLRPYGILVCVGIGERVGVDSVDRRILRFQRPQHVIERTVFHHQHDDVLQLVEAWWHGNLLQYYIVQLTVKTFLVRSSVNECGRAARLRKIFG